jgi:anti-anti-sigma regulatory factor
VESSSEIRARIERDYLMVPVAGDLDADGWPTLQQRLETIDPNTDVVLDLSNVTKVTDEAWNMLVGFHRRLIDIGGSLTLSRVSVEVRAALRAHPAVDELKVRRRDR